MLIQPLHQLKLVVLDPLSIKIELVLNDGTNLPLTAQIRVSVLFDCRVVALSATL